MLPCSSCPVFQLANICTCPCTLHKPWSCSIEVKVLGPHLAAIEGMGKQSSKARRQECKPIGGAGQEEGRWESVPLTADADQLLLGAVGWHLCQQASQAFRSA